MATDENTDVHTIGQKVLQTTLADHGITTTDGVAKLRVRAALYCIGDTFVDAVDKYGTDEGPADNTGRSWVAWCQARDARGVDALGSNRANAVVKTPAQRRKATTRKAVTEAREANQTKRETERKANYRLVKLGKATKVLAGLITAGDVRDGKAADIRTLATILNDYAHGLDNPDSVK